MSAEDKRFPMDPGDIVLDYRQASNKQKQIKILADMNVCSSRDIAELLQERGEPLPKMWVDKLARPKCELAANPDGLIDCEQGRKTHICEVCGYSFQPMIPRHYVALDPELGGLAAAISGKQSGFPLWDAFDCPFCGSQFLAQRRAKRIENREENITCLPISETV